MDRARLLEALALTEQHVREGERHLNAQRRLIDELRRDGHTTKMALTLLQTLEQTQALHLAHRDRIRERLSCPP